MNYNDIYYSTKYGKLYEDLENGELKVFEYNTNIGTIKNIFIKREIPVVGIKEKYYDITTPYGYGGPIILNCNNDLHMDELVNGYNNEFRRYCLDNNIVSEFIRFHPINCNYKDFLNIYEIEFVRKTIGTNLKDYDDPILNEFGKGCRKEIKRALNRGVNFKLTRSPSNLNKFKEIYYKTMDRNNASEYYYFGEKYFDNILRDFKDELLITELSYNDEIIASEMYFITDRLIHAHLVGSLDEYLYLSAGCVLEYATALWGKDNGFDYIHHGGGRTNDENDSLFRYKKKFGQNTEFDFHIGKKIWDIDKYNELCKINNVNLNTNFFPAYRSDKLS